MIKVNYDSDTGKVVAFGKDTEPFIEITEQERKQPLPDKYSYYAVESGNFVIKRRTPTVEETENDNRNMIMLEINQLKSKLSVTDYQAIKFAEGALTEDEFAAAKAQRAVWRARINELEGQLNGNSENS